VTHRPSVISRATLARMLVGFTLVPARVLAADAAPVTLRIGAAANETYAGVYYAQDMGFFRDAGLDVEITTMVSGAAIVAGVVGGALDIGGAGTSAIANAHIRGLPVYMVAPGGIYTTASPTSGLIVGKTSAIRSAKDLSGKVVAVTTLHDIAQAAVMSWIDKNGGDSSSVQFIEMPASEMGAAVTAARIDAAFVPEPNFSQALSDTRLLGPAYDGIAPRFMVIGWFSTKSYLDANLDTAKKFNAVMRRTADWAAKNPQRSAEILAKYSKLPAEVIAGTHRAASSQTIDPALIQPVIDTCVQYKIMPQRFPASDLLYPGLR
jgi:NitT/TauT family transport system substrate-binding protein